MSTYSKEYYHYITVIATIPTDTILWAHDENKGLTTFQAQWSSNPSQEALTLFNKWIISHGVQKNDYSINSAKTLQ